VFVDLVQFLLGKRLPSPLLLLVPYQRPDFADREPDLLEESNRCQGLEDR